MAARASTAPRPGSQAAILQQQLDSLAEIGGKLAAEEDIVFEGTKFIIPQRLNLPEAVKFLRKRAEDEEMQINFSRTYNYRPWDGAYATAQAIRRTFGYTQGKTIRTFFGDRPPQLIDIQTGPAPHQRESVPWGAMVLPGLDEATLHLGATAHKELGTVFQIVVECKRKDRFIIEGLFTVIENILVNESIYRGRAIDGADQPNFIDTSTVKAEDVVYTESVVQQLEANIWLPIRHADKLAARGMPGKRTILLEGPFGTGKTLAAALSAQEATKYGYTFVMCRPGVDDPMQVIQTATIYQPSVVFIEDVDTFTGPGTDKDAVTRVLDAFDGVRSKGLRMLMVMTTNHAELIHKGMLRPGRLDAVVHIGFMDRPGVEKLARRVIGDALEEGTDFDKVFRAMEGYTPAFVKESFDRAVLYSMARNNGDVGPISTSDLVGGANGLRDHLALMDSAHEVRSLPGIDGKLDELITTAVDRIVEQRIDGAPLYDGDDNYVGSIRTN